MVRKISLSIATFVLDDIERLMDLEGMTNRSEFIEELIRYGLVEYKKKKYNEVDDDE